MVLFTTERLVLRRFTVADAGFVIALWNDPDLVANVADRGIRTESDAVRYLEEKLFPRYEEPGHGAFLVERRDTGEAAGFCGLFRRQGFELPDIGYAFLPRFRGIGYASEAAAGMLVHARDTLGLAGVFGFTAPGNQRSIRILERLGLQRLRTFEMEGYPGETVWYERRFLGEPGPA